MCLTILLIQTVNYDVSPVTTKSTSLKSTLYSLDLNLNDNASWKKESTWFDSDDQSIGMSALDTFQDFLIAKQMKPYLHTKEISISSLKHVIVRPTKTPKSADKKCQFLTFKVNFLCQKFSESF